MVFTNSIKHPDEFKLSTGKTDLVREVQSINQSIRLILTSAKGELFGDPDFGSRLYEYIYDYSGSSLYHLLRTEIVNALTKQDTRIIVKEDDISFEEEGLTLKIKVSYTIKYSNVFAESVVLISKEENPWLI